MNDTLAWPLASIHAPPTHERERNNMHTATLEGKQLLHLSPTTISLALNLKESLSASKFCLEG